MYARTPSARGGTARVHAASVGVAMAVCVAAASAQPTPGPGAASNDSTTRGAPPAGFSVEVGRMREAARAAGIPEGQWPRRTLLEMRAEKLGRVGWKSKLDSIVRDRMEVLIEAGLTAPDRRALAPQFATPACEIDALARLKVECKVTDLAPFGDAYFQSIGGQLVAVAPTIRYLIAWVPAEQLPALASRPEMIRVMHIDPPYTDLGNHTTEGDAVHNCDDARNLFGLTGAGQTVGVISDGVTTLAYAIAQGDLLAANVTVDNAGAGDEGTAMCEIVADLAPGAQIRFWGGQGGTANMVNAINGLVANGCTIITDDLPYPGEPLFEDGPIAQAKQAAFAAGVFYTASAGNRNGEHYENNFSCTSANVAIGGAGTFDCPHDFGGGAYLLPFTTTRNNNTIYLQWAEPFGSSGIDLDLYIIDAAMNNVIGSSTDLQDGDDNPTEVVQLNAASGTNAFILVEHFGGGVGGTNVFFDLRAFGTTFGAGNVPAGSINGASRQVEVYAAAAVNWSTPNTLEGFSSRGPIRHFFPAFLTRMKPDGAATDGTTGSGAGCFGCGTGCVTPPAAGCSFFGTSAATPHVAGIAALVRQFVALNPTQLANRLNTNAIDIDAPGPDNNAGFGRLDALRAVADCATDFAAPSLNNVDFPGGNVNANCTITFNYSATVDDNRCIDAANVSAAVTRTGGSATVVAPAPTIAQNGPTQVTISGTVTVSNVTACPVQLRLRVNATDCCMNAAVLDAFTNVQDVTPPMLTVPAPIILPRGDKICTNAVQNWLDSATATDNCDANVAIVNDSATMGFACGFPYDSTTVVTWTATDDCGNSASQSSTITILPAPRASVSQKGSVLVWPHVEIRWNANGQLVRDTLISLSNDFQTGDVRFKLFFVNGDAPVPPYGPTQGAIEPGWNYFDNVIDLTHDEPLYWSSFNGQGGSQAVVAPFRALDPNGRAQPGGTFVVRGFLIGIAINQLGVEIRYNHLRGSAVIVDYGTGKACEYPAWAYQTACKPHGQQVPDCTMFDANGVCCTSSLVPGQAQLNTFSYDASPEQLLLEFYASFSGALGQLGNIRTADTQLSLVPMIHDFTPTRPIEAPPTDIRVEVWNQDEIKYTNLRRCFQCWDSTLLSVYGSPNHFLLANLATPKGKARFKGVANPVCNRPADPNSSPPTPPLNSVASPLLGVAQRFLFAGANPAGCSSVTLSLVGIRSDGLIRFIPQGDPPEIRRPRPIWADVVGDAWPKVGRDSSVAGAGGAARPDRPDE